MKSTKVYSDKEYRMAIKEFLVIIENIPQSDYDKIPKNVINELQMNADESYDFKLDYDKSLKDQPISELTKAMIENFYKEYWVTEPEREKISEEENEERVRIEIEKREKYNPDNLFKNNSKEETKQEPEEHLELVEVKEKSFFEKIIEKITQLFKRIKK